MAPMIDPPRVEGYADALCEAIPQDAVLIGHSLGGMVALELAARMPERIAALILIEAVPTVRDRLSGHVAGTLATALFSRIPPGWFAALSGIGHPQATQAELRRQMRRLDRGQIRAALEAARHYDGRSRLSLVRAPTLVIVGEKSGATLHGATLMAETIPGARLLKLPGGHMLHTDNPLQLRRAIDGFVRATLPEDSGRATIAALPTQNPRPRSQ
jgi:pimeloyl-ACP methyl ester carboxylesterase